MLTSRSSKKKQLSPCRNSKEPGTIFLRKGDYILTEADLKKQVDKSLFKSRIWFFPRLEFISFQKSCLSLVNRSGKSSYELQITISPGSLQLTCSCGVQTGSLCIHAYRALERMTWYGQADFAGLQRSGALFALAARHGKYFEISAGDRGFTITADKKLGGVFQLPGNTPEIPMDKILALTGSNYNSAEAPMSKVLTYFLLYSRRQKFMPFLAPCFGVPNKSGQGIRGFCRFEGPPGDQPDPALLPWQLKLLATSRRIRELTREKTGKLLEWLSTEELYLSPLLGVWQEAFQQLSVQPYVFGYPLWGLEELNHVPTKSRIEKISVVAEPPSLRFVLEDLGPFFQLRLSLLIRGTTLKGYEIPGLFFISHNHQFYLAGCVRDAAMMAWMDLAGGKITIFKEQFSDFEKQVLLPLRSCYPLDMNPSSNRQK